jgi:hypothetical protein
MNSAILRVPARHWMNLAVVTIVGAACAQASGTPLPGAPKCRVFPADNVWNAPVDQLPLASNSAALVSAIGLDASLHPDFSNQGNYGIPFNVVGRKTPRQRIRGFEYGDESDRVKYPIPKRPKIEGGSDRHMLMIDRDGCKLYELFGAQRSGAGWRAGSGAVWNLSSNALRRDGWTSADAAGLPIFPGLVRFDEVKRGTIDHALRFTASRTGTAHIFPARHDAGSDDASLPPMGLRVRLKASVSLDGFGPQSKVLLAALKRYGMILADNGSPWYVTGAPDRGWNDDDLHGLGKLTGADFEAVDTSGLR